MPIAQLKKALKKRPQPFDWFAFLVLASFAFIVASVVDKDIQQFGEEMDIEARHLQAEILSIKNFKAR